MVIVLACVVFWVFWVISVDSVDDFSNFYVKERVPPEYRNPRKLNRLISLILTMVDQFDVEMLLEKLVNIEDNIGIVLPHNHCPDCLVPMEIVALEYQCGDCGRIMPKVDDSSKEDIITTRIQKTTGVRGSFYNPTSDYTRTQKKTLLAQFSKLKAEYMDKHRDAIAIPDRVLDTVCEIYNNIQKSTMQKSDGTMTSDNQADGKKFVRRGSIKDEILAALIYAQCINEGVARKKKDISIFMKLSTQGFSKGEAVVRDLIAQKVIDFKMDPNKGSSYVERYLTALNIDSKYAGFVDEIVEASKSNHICMASQIDSKIVGAIWMLIQVLKLEITSKQLEAATDNTKKNTFDKFSKAIASHMKTFSPIFKKYELIA